MLISENEARRLFFSPEARPTASQMARLRRVYNLPALHLGRRILYFKDDLEAHLKSLQRPQAE